MNFETLKKSHLKRNIIIGVVAVLVISAVILNFTRAKYRVTQSIPLVNGTINYSLADLNVVALYINGIEVEELDSSKRYILDTSQSTCTYKDGSPIDNLNLSYDSETGHLNISPFTAKGIKCYLYFDEKVSAVDFIIANKNISDERSGAITDILEDDTTGIVYSVTDDWGTSYAYAGAPTDNWVQFAEYWWRIIRINGDGSIRMIYQGTSANTVGEGTQIQISAYNSLYNDNAYVGYMYGSAGVNSYSSTHANNNDSTIKDILDSWYKENIVDTGNDKNVSKEAGFCNDRKTQNEIWPGYGDLGYGTNNTGYAPAGRLISNGSYKTSQNPSLKCSQTNDLFTTNESSKGNHKLTYPIGLITSDEVVVAGGFGGRSNGSYYLYTNQSYRTMSPFYFDYGNAWVFGVDSGGYLNGWNVNSTIGVRPVINLKADTQFTGSGTVDDPFTVV